MLCFGKVKRAKKELGFLQRSQMDIITEILQEAVWDAKKTRIMLRCNLNFRQLQTYLDLLLNNGLLRSIFESSNATLQTTNKGRTFLKAYYNLKALLA